MQEDTERRAEEAEMQVKDLEKVNQRLARRIHELEAGSNGQSSYSDIQGTR